MVNHLLFLGLILGFLTPSLAFANDISVDAYDEQRNNPGFLTLRLRVTNNTEDSLRNVQLKYNLPFDRARSLQVQGYYLGNPPQAATLSMDTLGNTITLNINIAVMGPGSYPNQGGMSIGMYYADRQDFKKNSSACYPDTNTFANTEKIPVFIENSLALGVASSSPMGLIDSSEVYLFPNQAVPFAWQPIPGAKLYKLTIYNKTDTSLVYEEITDRSSSKVSLGQGKYLWHVQASPSYGFAYQEWNIGMLDGFYRLISVDTLEAEDSRVHIIVDRHVTPLAARKDTPMLDLKWGELLDSMEWDRPHNTTAYIDTVDGQLKFSDPKHRKWDNSEGWRCWAVATIMLNHYYGGNATQDELVFSVMALARKDSTLHAFSHGNNGGGGFRPEWAFGPVKYEETRMNTPASTLIASLNRRNPAAICEIGHCMVVDACAYYDHDAKQDTLCRFLNIDNNGSSAWINWANHARHIDGGFFVVKEGETPVPRMSDSLIIDPETGAWRDTDGDGILDYDEIYRFHTDPLKKDSDNDSIEDKVEIWSYTRLEPYDINAGVLKENYANIDGDSVRAELDNDSDNDGLEDGMEDSNYNGYIDKGETNPYYDENKNHGINIPDYFGMYALNQLAVNDGAKCYEGVDTLLKIYCNVAAAGESTVGYTVNIGSKAIVNNVYSRGDFFLRSFSEIDTLYLTNRIDDEEKNRLTGVVYKIHVQDGFKREYKGFIENDLWKSQWPTSFEIDFFETRLEDVTVKAGNELTPKKGEFYKLIRVESMGILVFEPGEYWVDELQLHSGSRLLFTQPGKSTILHINRNLYWHPTIINVDYPMVAKGFKIIHHGAINMFIEGMFAGTIAAPKCSVTLGQSTKSFYGSIIAKDITLHQHSKFYHIPYKPE